MENTCRVISTKSRNTPLQKTKIIELELSCEQYEMLKNYAKAMRKYEVGKGFTIKSAIEYALSIGLNAIEETIFVDNDHKEISWNT